MKTYRILIACFLFCTAASAEWHYGVDTGLYRLNVDGDLGLTVAESIAVEVPVDLDPDDVSDLMKSAAGLSGYATNGEWFFTADFTYLDLEGSGSTPEASLDVEFQNLSFEALAGYPVFREGDVTVRIHGGFRYTNHQLDADVEVPSVISRKRSIDESWTDALVAVTLDWQLAERWVWNNRVDGGFGESEGMFFGQTGVTWMFHDHWAAVLYVNYRSVDFEDGNAGDSDYYSYDADEYGSGLSIMYHW